MPVLEWLRSLELDVVIKCRAHLARLQERGHLLRRPEADYVGEGLYELRILRAGQRYRLLYAFHGRESVVLLTAFAKAERRIPLREIRLARHRLDRFCISPELHGHFEKGL